ncbi:MAG: hypothetical protein ACK4NF_05280, partial [Planctomycetota bacterium]
VKNKLKPGGIFVQWFHTYHIKPDLVKSLIKTFATIFPEVMLHCIYREELQTYSNDIFLVGSENKLVMDYSYLKKIFLNKKIFKDLLRIEIYHPTQVLTTLYLHKKDIPKLEGWNYIKLNTDNNMYIEFSASRYLEMGDLAIITHNEIEKIRSIFFADTINFSIKDLLEFDAIKSGMFRILPQHFPQSIKSLLDCFTTKNKLCGIGLFYLYLRNSNYDLALKFLAQKLRKILPAENFLDLLFYYHTLMDNFKTMRNILLKLNKMNIKPAVMFLRSAIYFKSISDISKFFKYMKKAIKKDRYNLSFYKTLLIEARNYNRADDYVLYYKLMRKRMFPYSIATKLISSQLRWASVK